MRPSFTALNTGVVVDLALGGVEINSLSIVRSRWVGATNRAIIARPTPENGDAGHACRGAAATDVALVAVATRL